MQSLQSDSWPWTQGVGQGQSYKCIGGGMGFWQYGTDIEEYSREICENQLCTSCYCFALHCELLGKRSAFLIRVRRCVKYLTCIFSLILMTISQSYSHLMGEDALVISTL